MSNGIFKTHGMGKLRIRFIDCSASRDNLVQPNIVEYDRRSMRKPVFDLILGTNILKELGIVLNFLTKEIDMDKINLPMRDITKLSTRANIEMAWMVNNSVMIHEPKNTLAATQWVIKILDAKYEKADLNAVVTENCTTT